MTRAELINTIIEAVGKDGIDRVEVEKVKIDRPQIERPQYHRADGTYGPIDLKKPPTLMDKVKKMIKRK